MLYAIMARDAANSLPLRTKARPAHIAYLGRLIEEGRVVLAGPHPAIDSPDPGPGGFSGSLIVAEFESLQAAETWAAQDPYTTGGVFEHVTVKPFLQVHP